MPLPSGQRAIIAPPLAGHHQRVPSAQFIILTVGHVELGLTLQRGVDAVKVLALFEQEIILADVPGHVSLLGRDLSVGRRGDEPAPGFRDILLVIEWQRLAQPVLQFDGVLRGHFALGMEMLNIFSSCDRSAKRCDERIDKNEFCQVFHDVVLL